MADHLPQKKHRKRHETWNRSIRKVLNRGHPSFKIDKLSKLMMNDILNQLNHRLSKLSVKMSDHANKKTVSSKDIQASIRLALPTELANLATNMAVGVVTKYTSSKPGDKSNPISRSSRAGLDFPVSKVDRILKKNALHKKGRLGDSAAVYLAAVLEYLTTKILRDSCSCAENRHTTQISPRDIMLAIRKDEAGLNTLFKRHHILGTGVVPNISGGAANIKPAGKKRVILRDNIFAVTKPAIRRILRRAGITSISGLVYGEIRGVVLVFLQQLLQATVYITLQRRAKTITYQDYKEAADIIGIKTISAEQNFKLCRKRARKQKAGGEEHAHHEEHAHDEEHDHGEEVKKPFRHRKGWVAKQSVRKNQKTSCLFIPHAPMRRIIRELLADIGHDLRQSKTGLMYVHSLIEHYITDIAMDANLCARHAKRTMLMPKDIQIARTIRGERL